MWQRCQSLIRLWLLPIHKNISFLIHRIHFLSFPALISSVNVSLHITTFSLCSIQIDQLVQRWATGHITGVQQGQEVPPRLLFNGYQGVPYEMIKWPVCEVGHHLHLMPRSRRVELYLLPFTPLWRDA
jgi:hypothetical protein